MGRSQRCGEAYPEQTPQFNWNSASAIQPMRRSTKWGLVLTGQQGTLSNSPYQEGRRHEQAEHKSGSYSLFFVHRRFADFARGFNDLRIFAGGVVLADRRVQLITVAIYSPASAERLMRHHSK
jgi:hypothetical protein